VWVNPGVVFLRANDCIVGCCMDGLAGLRRRNDSVHGSYVQSAKATWNFEVLFLNSDDGRLKESFI